MSQKQSRFFPEIEGLRALALVAVLLFHAEIALLQRGYLGVDSFFVISGFLITRLLKREVEAHGSIKFGRFYLRRLRRLFPTLALVITVTTLVGWYILQPQDVGALGASVVAATLSASNIYFWAQTGYFDPEAFTKPLLHTWSLSVEEQFYLVWPATVLLAYRYLGSRGRIWAVVTLLFGSATGALYYSGDLGDAGAALALDAGSDSFFLPWWRGFEFLIGAMLVGLPSRLRPHQASRLGLLSLGSLLAVFLLPARWLPGEILPELVASLATAGLIASGPHGPAAWLLRTRPCRWVGRVSYSAYLWHWPFFALFRYHKQAAPDPLEVCGLLLLTFAVSALSWRYVEEVFRRPARNGSSIRFVGSVLGASALLLLGGLRSYYGASPSWTPGDGKSEALVRQLHMSRKEHLAYNLQVQEKLPSTFANTKMTKLLVIGDSQAADLINALREVHAEFDVAYHPTSAKCQVMYGIPFSRFADKLPPKQRAACRKDNKNLQKLTALDDAELVLVSMAYRDWTPPFIAEVVENLTTKNRRVLVVGPKMLNYDALPFAEKNSGLSENARDALFALHPLTVSVDAALGQRLPAERYLSLSALLCAGPGDCATLTSEGASVYSDKMHFTQEGARWFGERLMRSQKFRDFISR